MNSTEFDDFFKKMLIYNSEEFINKIEGIVRTGAMFGVNFKEIEKVFHRREANILTRLFFRDTDLENAHATYSGEILTYQFVEQLMDESSQDLEEWLIMRDDLLETAPTIFNMILKCCEAIKSLDRWNQEPVIGKGDAPINISLVNYKEYNIDTLTKPLSDLLKNNTVSFISNIIQYCQGAIKKYQGDIDLIYERENDEARVITEFCFARSIPTSWFGKDMLTDSNMKELMIISSTQLTEWLMMRDTLMGYDEDLYVEIIYLMAAALDI